MSKGAKQRPIQVPPETFAEKWARTFGDPAPKPEGK